jgi:hypothetical protein
MNNQLLLWNDPPEEIQSRKIAHLEEKYDKLRKSQHARISGLQTELKDVKSELEFLKMKICKEGLFL